MLFFGMLACVEPRSADQNSRRSHSSALRYCRSPVFSYTYKLPPLSSQKTAPLFSCAYELPFLQVLSFDIHASDGGCRGYPSFSSSITLSAQVIVGAPRPGFWVRTLSPIHKKEVGQTFLSVPGISVDLVPAGGGLTGNGAVQASPAKSSMVKQAALLFVGNHDVVDGVSLRVLPLEGRRDRKSVV